MNYFDHDRWREAATHPDWYVRISDDYKRVTKLAEDKPDFAPAIKEEVRNFFEQLITDNVIPLGSPNPFLDSARQPIDTIVIHHTSAQPGYTLARMNVVHLLNVYAPYYASPHVAGEEHLKGQAVASNHYQNGQMVFYAYHWFVRMDGSAERLLDDDQIGWHAGNWDINTRSVAICLDNNYENAEPTPEVLRTVAKLLRDNYQQVNSNKIIGHCEANPKTICPGSTFLSNWKSILINLIA